MEISMQDLKDLIGPVSDSPYTIGCPYFIRTVTHYHIGILGAVHDKELVLTRAAWIADTGRFADAIKSGEFDEVEPFPEDRRVIINRSAIIDAVAMPGLALPLSQK